MKKLTFLTPPDDLVDAYLGEIAKGYGVDWAPEPKNDDDLVGGGGTRVISEFLFHFETSHSRYACLLHRNFLKTQRWSHLLLLKLRLH